MSLSFLSTLGLTPLITFIYQIRHEKHWTMVKMLSPSRSPPGFNAHGYLFWAICSAVCFRRGRARSPLSISATLSELAHVPTVNAKQLRSNRAPPWIPRRWANDLSLGVDALRQTVLMGLTTQQWVTIPALILKKGKLNGGCSTPRHS